MTDPQVRLEGGPVDGAVIPLRDPRSSLQVMGDEHGRPGFVARYRPTRRADQDGRRVFAFKGWAKIIATIAPPGCVR